MRIQANIDPEGLFGRQLSDLERSQVPYATMQAINATSQQVHDSWRQILARVFDRPTDHTKTSVLYKKATKQNLSSDIFIRDEAAKGTPPAKYLQAEVMGGVRRHTGFEKRLGAAGILPVGDFVVPGLGVKLDGYGNIPRSQINQILSQLNAQRDPTSNQTEASRKRRQARERGKRGSGITTDIFAVSRAGGHLKPGVYLRARVGNFGTAIKSLLHFVSGVKYRKRFDIFSAAQKTYERRFPDNFREQLDRAVASTWARAFK